jgi:hypothetical protein
LKSGSNDLDGLFNLLAHGAGGSRCSSHGAI